MTDSSKPTLIGIDGGGTSCRIAILRHGKRSEIKVGRANVSTDRHAALKTIIDGLSEAASAAEIPQEELRHCHAYLGLAGVVSDTLADFIASNLPFHTVQVHDDRPSAVAGALGHINGTVAGIGTGSFMARQTDDHQHLIGGWGLILGDDASGGWLGRALLSRVLLAVDGLLPPSHFSRKILEELGGTAGVVDFSLSAAPRDFATFAPRIVSAAAQGDMLAVGLMTDGAGYIERGAAALGRTAGEPLCLIGGLAPNYAPYLSPEHAASLREPEGSSLDGTLQLAERIGQSEVAP